MKLVIYIPQTSVDAYGQFECASRFHSKMNQYCLEKDIGYAVQTVVVNNCNNSYDNLLIKHHELMGEHYARRYLPESTVTVLLYTFQPNVDVTEETLGIVNSIIKDKGISSIDAIPNILTMAHQYNLWLEHIPLFTETPLELLY